jgi:hypothetical protein
MTATLRMLALVPLVLAMVACQRPPAPAQTVARVDQPAGMLARKPVVTWTGLATPEAVIHDPSRDRYLVSNINGRPLEADGNGFISVLRPDGTIEKLQWIAGGSNGVTLNAPKGMAIVGNVLHVTDLDTLRSFDLSTGAPLGAVTLEGATCANDVAVGADGRIFVSDSGLTMEGSEFKPTGTDAVWVVEGRTARLLARTTGLAKPNGLLIDGESLIVVAYGNNEAYRLGADGVRSLVTALPAGGLDGVLKVGEALLVSSWEGKAVYAGKLGGMFTPVLEQVEAPADLGYDAKRRRVLVPRFLGDVVEAYDLE